MSNEKRNQDELMLEFMKWIIIGFACILLFLLLSSCNSGPAHCTEELTRITIKYDKLMTQATGDFYAQAAINKAKLRELEQLQADCN